MATYTDNYNLIKPTYAETADIVPLNNNFEKIDEVMHASQTSLAPAYDQTASYQPGDVVMYELNMYKCTGATSGTWDPSKWTRTTAAETGGGGSVDFDIFGEGSGSVVTITDGAEAGLAECIVEIEATQSGSGTPSPSNVRPIVGRSEVNVSVTGKNLLPNTGIGATVNGITYVVNDDGSVTASGTATGMSTFRIITTTDLFKLKAGNYTISGGISANRALGFKTVDGTTQYNNSGDTSITLTEMTTWDYIFIRIASGETLNNVTFYPMIRLASESSSEYEPYNGSTTIIPLDRTVYGGTLDVTRRILTVTKKYATFNDISTWTYDSTRTRFQTGHITDMKTVAGSVVNDIITSCTQMYSNNQAWDGHIDGASWTSDDYFYVSIHDYTSVTDLLNAIGNEQIVYTLATPQTYTFTTEEVSTILGYNNISADSGEVSVVYVKQTAPIKPNPTGADIPLTGIEIDGEKFKIEGGGATIDVLYSNANGAPESTTLPLTHNFRDYDEIYMKISNVTDINNFNIYCHTSFMPIMVGNGERVSVQALYGQRAVDVLFDGATFNVIRVDGDYRNTVYEIVGIKY